MQFGETEIVVQLLSHVRHVAAPWISLSRLPSFISYWSLLRLMSVESVLPSNHLILCCPFSSCPQSFPASGSFPVSRFFTSSGQSIGVWVSVLPVNIQDWFPLGWTGWISLQSKELSRVFSWNLFLLNKGRRAAALPQCSFAPVLCVCRQLCWSGRNSFSLPIKLTSPALFCLGDLEFWFSCWVLWSPGHWLYFCWQLVRVCVVNRPGAGCQFILS